jgi:tetratricopeptide (TPR) repeat protein
MKKRPAAHRRLAGRTRSDQTGKAGSVILVIFLGGIVGVAWALFDYNQKGGDNAMEKLWDKAGDRIARLAPSESSEPPAATHRTPNAGVKPTPQKPPSPAVRQDPKSAGGTATAKAPNPTVPPARVETPPAPPSPAPTPPAPATSQETKVAPLPPVPPATPPKPAVEMYGIQEIDRAMRMAQADLKACNFASARERVNKYETDRVAQGQQKEFQAMRDRCELHFNLFRETNLSPAADPPKLTSVEFRIRRTPMTGTVLSKDNKKVELLTITNMTVSLPAHEILEMLPVDSLRARRVVEAEYDRRSKQIVPGKLMEAFRLAEFCLRNGLLENVAACFDQAAQMAAKTGADLITTVRDEKAAGLYDTYRFFVTLGDTSSAKSALDLLRKRYAESPLIAHADRLEHETWKEANDMLRSEIRLAAATPASPPPPAVAPAPSSTDTTIRTPVKPPKPVEPSPVPAYIPPPPMSTLPAEKQNAFRECVDQANECYDKALGHLKRSDQSINPDGWQRENKEAQELLARAYKLYNQALDIYNDSSLWERVKDTNFKRVMCRKRMIQ